MQAAREIYYPASRDFIYRAVFVEVLADALSVTVSN